MTIEKLTEFAKTGQKNTDDLDLETGFIVNRKPARQWFNWLFNSLTLKINEIIDDKLDKTENAATASQLLTARSVSFSGAATGSFSYNGSANSSCVLTLANSGVAASTYGSNVTVPVITVNAKGIISSVSNQAIRAASTTQTGIVQLVDDLVTDDATKAATARQVKLLHGLLFGVNQSTKERTIISGTTYTHTGAKPMHLSIGLSGSSTTKALIVHKGNILLDTNSSNRYVASLLLATGDDYTISGNSIVCVEYS